MGRLAHRYIAFGIAYFSAAAAPIALTRLDGGLAFVWIATALLVAKLRTTDRRSWAGWLSAAGIASMFATGLFGLGWAAAPALMALNLLDAIVAVGVLFVIEARRGSISDESDVPAIIAACLAGAIATMIPAGAVSALAVGTPMTGNVANWVIGHALGSLTFGPFMFLCMRGDMCPWLIRVITGRDMHSLVAVLLLVSACVLAFNHPNLSFLFLPVLALVVLAYGAGLPGAAFGSVLLGVVGGGLTLAGRGVAEFASPALTFQFFEFFLGMTTVTMLPVSAIISARKEMTERLEASEAGYRLLADNIDDVVVRLDLHGRITYVSPSIRFMAGQRPADVAGHSALDLIDPCFVREARRALADVIAARGEPVTFEFIGNTNDEQKRWFEMQYRCVLDEVGEPASIVGTVRETTGRRMLEAALASAAESDQLTGLLIRRAFFDAAQVTVQGGPACYLALFDLDHLDAINTVIGHEAGDLALLTFASVSRRIARKHDLLGRLEGDTFGLLLPNTTQEQAEAICQRLLAVLAGERLIYGERLVTITASAGLALLGDNLEAAIRIARAAVARAKEQGRARLVLAV